MEFLLVSILIKNPLVLNASADKEQEETKPQKQITEATEEEEEEGKDTKDGDHLELSSNDYASDSNTPANRTECPSEIHKSIWARDSRGERHRTGTID